MAKGAATAIKDVDGDRPVNQRSTHRCHMGKWRTRWMSTSNVACRTRDDNNNNN